MEENDSQAAAKRNMQELGAAMGGYDIKTKDGNTATTATITCFHRIKPPSFAISHGACLSNSCHTQGLCGGISGCEYAVLPGCYLQGFGEFRVWFETRLSIVLAGAIFVCIYSFLDGMFCRLMCLSSSALVNNRGFTVVEH